MLTNERIRRLVDADREALVVLLAAAMSGRLTALVGRDPDAQALLDEARDRAAPPPHDRTPLARWNDPAP
jgi:hypothetical protein